MEKHLVNTKNLPDIHGFSWNQFIEFLPKTYCIQEDYSNTEYTNLKIYMSMLNECVHENIFRIFKTHNQINNKEEQLIYSLINILCLSI